MSKPRRTVKTERQRDQRRVAKERADVEALRRRSERADVLPRREDEGRYRP